MRVLFVEDEKTASSGLHKELIAAGFLVDRAADIRSAVSLTCVNDYDLMIANDALRGIDGVTLLRHLRSTGNATPALLLADSELGLEQIAAAGVDDVLLKSSTPTERLERVQALLRTFASRRRPERSRLFVADLELDTTHHTVYRNRRPLQLTPRELATVELLLKHQGEIVTCALIAACSLPRVQRSPKAIDVHMRRLRYKIDGNSTRKLLHTVWGAGFVLEDRSLR